MVREISMYQSVLAAYVLYYFTDALLVSSLLEADWLLILRIDVYCRLGRHCLSHNGSYPIILMPLSH